MNNKIAEKVFIDINKIEMKELFVYIDTNVVTTALSLMANCQIGRVKNTKTQFVLSVMFSLLYSLSFFSEAMESGPNEKPIASPISSLFLVLCSCKCLSSHTPLDKTEKKRSRINKISRLILWYTEHLQPVYSPGWQT